MLLTLAGNSKPLHTPLPLESQPMKSPLVLMIGVTVTLGMVIWFAIQMFLGSSEHAYVPSDLRSRPAASAAVGSTPENEPAERRESAEYSESAERHEAAERSEPAGAGEAAVRDETVVRNEAASRNEVAERNQAAARSKSAERSDEKKSDSNAKALRPAQLTNQQREAKRRARLAELGLITKPAPEPTTAVDVSLHMPESCVGHEKARIPVGLKFRFDSYSIRGESLHELEKLVASYRNCKEGLFVLAENPLGSVDRSATLVQVRLDEIKYFFIQHSIPTESIQFPLVND